tara:strand:+ start:216 stop:578 length:363 start_codon:yes stop_codon:yes gene_type:complete
MIEANLSPQIAMMNAKANHTDPARVLDSSTLKRIDESAKEFEAIFISEMIKPMFEGLETDGMFGGGQGEEIFRNLMFQEFGNNIANNNGVGIADHVKEQLIRIQAKNMPTPRETGTDFAK